MKPALSTLTVTFEDPFWIGLYEREEDGQYQVCKILFGAEPKDAQVYAFLQRHWTDLTFSPPLPAETAVRPRPNPKRLQRAIQKQLDTPALGTKAQRALQRRSTESPGPPAAGRPRGPAVCLAPTETPGKAPGPLSPSPGRPCPPGGFFTASGGRRPRGRGRSRPAGSRSVGWFHRPAAAPPPPPCTPRGPTDGPGR